MWLKILTRNSNLKPKRFFKKQTLQQKKEENRDLEIITTLLQLIQLIA